MLDNKCRRSTTHAALLWWLTLLSNWTQIMKHGGKIRSSSLLNLYAQRINASLSAFCITAGWPSDSRNMEGSEHTIRSKLVFNRVTHKPRTYNISQWLLTPVIGGDDIGMLNTKEDRLNPHAELLPPSLATLQNLALASVYELEYHLCTSSKVGWPWGGEGILRRKQKMGRTLQTSYFVNASYIKHYYKDKIQVAVVEVW